MTFEEWYEENSDYTLVYIESVSTQRAIIAERAWNAAKEDDARICNAYAKETRGNMHKSLAAFECAKLIKRSMK